jgi:hypothetical protein
VYTISPDERLLEGSEDSIRLDTYSLDGAEGKKIEKISTGHYPGPRQPVDFIILLEENRTPYGVYIHKRKKWILTDNMSGMTIHTQLLMNQSFVLD